MEIFSYQESITSMSLYLVWRWARESTELDFAALESQKSKALKLGCGRKPFDEDIDEETFVYIVSQRAQKGLLSRGLTLIQLNYFCGFTIWWAYYRGRAYNKAFTVCINIVLSLSVL